MIDKEMLDVVYICILNDVYYEIVLYVLNYNFYVIFEKLMMMNVDEVIKLY